MRMEEERGRRVIQFSTCTLLQNGEVGQSKMKGSWSRGWKKVHSTKDEKKLKAHLDRTTVIAVVVHYVPKRTVTRF